MSQPAADSHESSVISHQSSVFSTSVGTQPESHRSRRASVLPKTENRRAQRASVSSHRVPIECWGRSPCRRVAALFACWLIAVGCELSAATEGSERGLTVFSHQYFSHQSSVMSLQSSVMSLQSSVISTSVRTQPESHRSRRASVLPKTQNRKPRTGERSSPQAFAATCSARYSRCWSPSLLRSSRSNPPIG